MKRSKLFLFAAQVLLLAVAISFIFLGLARKENEDVERKATTICLECIGIG